MAELLALPDVVLRQVAVYLHPHTLQKLTGLSRLAYYVLRFDDLPFAVENLNAASRKWCPKAGQRLAPKSPRRQRASSPKGAGRSTDPKRTVVIVDPRAAEKVAAAVKETRKVIARIAREKELAAASVVEPAKVEAEKVEPANVEAEKELVKVGAEVKIITTEQHGAVDATAAAQPAKNDTLKPEPESQKITAFSFTAPAFSFAFAPPGDEDERTSRSQGPKLSLFKERDIIYEPTGNLQAHKNTDIHLGRLPVMYWVAAAKVLPFDDFSKLFDSRDHDDPSRPRDIFAKLVCVLRSGQKDCDYVDELPSIWNEAIQQMIAANEQKKVRALLAMNRSDVTTICHPIFPWLMADLEGCAVLPEEIDQVINDGAHLEAQAHINRACELGFANHIRTALACKIPLTFKPSQLHVAVERGFLDVVKLLCPRVKLDASVNLLSLAASTYPAMVKFFLGPAAQVPSTILDSWIDDALCTAVAGDKTDNFNMLLDSGRVRNVERAARLALGRYNEQIMMEFMGRLIAYAKERGLALIGNWWTEDALKHTEGTRFDDDAVDFIPPAYDEHRDLKLLMLGAAKAETGKLLWMLFDRYQAVMTEILKKCDVEERRKGFECLARWATTDKQVESALALLNEMPDVACGPVLIAAAEIANTALITALMGSPLVTPSDIESAFAGRHCKPSCATAILSSRPDAVPPDRLVDILSEAEDWAFCSAVLESGVLTPEKGGHVVASGMVRAHFKEKIWRVHALVQFGCAEPLFGTVLLMSYGAGAEAWRKIVCDFTQRGVAFAGTIGEEDAWEIQFDSRMLQSCKEVQECFAARDMTDDTLVVAYRAILDAISMLKPDFEGVQILRDGLK
ncbi:hypothetical protein HK101_010178 [Irineochytrium annulatum]|nr:hypothetical protein HK101_010178 [Irineochytrium annulatum]